MDIPYLLQAAFLGIVQGITEFLPVSSTGHLTIAQHIFHLDQARYGLSFDMFTNIGTSVALIWYFRKDLWDIARSMRIPTSDNPLSQQEKLPWWILGATIIVGLAGFILEDTIATTFRSLPLIAATLFVFGIVMLIAEKVAEKTPRSQAMSIVQAYIVGLAQIVAFIPGVSRSGATISAGLFAGLDRAAAARFSFLLSAPITVAAIAKRMLSAGSEFSQTGIDAQLATFYVIGALTAGITGYYAIRFLLAYLQKYSLAAFAYYRFILAGCVALYLLLS